jgi:hypothetical protein
VEHVVELFVAVFLGWKPPHHFAEAHLKHRGWARVVRR